MTRRIRPWLVVLWIGFLCLLAAAAALHGAISFIDYFYVAE